MHKWHFETQDMGLANKLHDVVKAHVGGPGSMAGDNSTLPIENLAGGQVFPPNPALIAPPPAAQVSAPAAPPVVAPPTAAAPPAPPAAPPAAPAHGQPPPGWTIEHIKSAGEAFTKDPSKGGPAAMKAICEAFGAKRLTTVDPARWPDLYAALTAPKA